MVLSDCTPPISDWKLQKRCAGPVFHIRKIGNTRSFWTYAVIITSFLKSPTAAARFQHVVLNHWQIRRTIFLQALKHSLQVDFVRYPRVIQLKPPVCDKLCVYGGPK
jgi:hypothetical protein